MQARFYLPQYGRFTSPDPARDQHFEETQSWNIYSYCQNNPVMRIDPDGMADKEAGYYWGLFYGYVRANSGNLIDHIVSPSSINRSPGFNAGERDGTVVAVAQAGAETGAGLTATTVGGSAALAGAPVGGVGAVPGAVVAGGGLLMTAHGAMVGTTGLANLSAGPSGQESGGSQPSRSEGPTYKTDKEARAQAEKLGYEPVKGDHGKAQVFKKTGKSDGPKYLSRDLDGHNGGAFKGADKIENLWQKTTRSGTYDPNLKKVGD